MIFNATPEQVKQIAANAVNASVPTGLGFLHYNPSQLFTTSDFAFDDSGCICLDYVQGRMVKLSILPEGESWYIPDNPTIDYQSWASTYPTTKALVNSVL